MKITLWIWLFVSGYVLGYLTMVYAVHHSYQATCNPPTEKEVIRYI